MLPGQKIDRQIFFAYDQSHFIDALDHIPEKVKLCHFEDPDRSSISTDTLDESALERWLITRPPISGGLQLILSSGYIRGVAPVSMELDVLPVSAGLFQRIMEEFHLPAATPWLIKSQSTHFQRYCYGSTTAPLHGFTMRLATRGVLWMNTLLSVSYDPARRLTCAFLHGCNPHQQEHIINQLKAFGPAAHHPLLLPVILAQMKCKVIADVKGEIWNTLIWVENGSGQTGVPAISIQYPREPDFVSLTKEALRVVQVAGGSKYHAETLQLTLESIRKCLASGPEGLDEGFCEEITEILIERVDFIEHTTREVLADLSFIGSRGEAQLSAIYNLLAHIEAKYSGEIARASKRDSTAMKGLALLSMVFLPATSIASFFAMPWFDFSAPSGPTIKSYFWIYWAIVIPLTASVLCIYFCYVVYTERKHLREDHAAVSLKTGRRLRD